jgi:hypothetical protein
MFAERKPVFLVPSGEENLALLEVLRRQIFLCISKCSLVASPDRQSLVPICFGKAVHRHEISTGHLWCYCNGIFLLSLKTEDLQGVFP